MGLASSLLRTGGLRLHLRLRAGVRKYWRNPAISGEIR